MLNLVFASSVHDFATAFSDGEGAELFHIVPHMLSKKNTNVASFVAARLEKSVVF
jgi:hypothetical protein